MLNWFLSFFKTKQTTADNSAEVPTNAPTAQISFAARGLGAISNEEDYRDIPLTTVQAAAGAPTAFMGIQPSLLKLPHYDQLNLPWCVPHAIGKVLKAYIYRKTGNIVAISPRYAAKLCKMFDGIPNQPGTYPRIGALVFTKFGCATEDILPNSISLSDADYRGFPLTDSINASAAENKLPGFATVISTNIEALKEAIYQNGCVTGATTVGNWNQLPLSLVGALGRHYTIWYGYELLNNGDYKIYIDNSWGDGWLAWILNWLWPGDGYFLWSEYQHDVQDIYAFTDIPADYLNQVKAMPYKFLGPLQQGMTGIAVQELQKLLNSDPDTALGLSGAGTPDEETMTFGPATFAAVQKWQKKHGLPSTGYFGPLSIAQANLRVPKIALVDAIIQTESGGDDYAKGDITLPEPAYGCLQIRQGVVDQVNTKLKASYKSSDCLGNRNLSLLIWNTYWTVFIDLVTDENRAKAWNGGPGWKSLYGQPGYESYSHKLDLYWATVENFMNN